MPFAHRAPPVLGPCAGPDKAHFLVEFMVYKYAPGRKNSALALLLERPLKMSLNFLCRWRFCTDLQTRDTQNQMCQKVI